MIVVEWNAVWIGLGVGVVVSALFFAGLAFGMRLALRTDRPVPVLVLSGVLRIAALLASGWAVTGAIGAYGLAGFAAAFFAARTIALIGARVPSAERGTV